MFSLIFVDDESIIRNGISKCIPWGKNGFTLAGLFEDGQKAYNYIKVHHVDVVITDVNMPRMDGLTLSRILADQYPKIMVLLLSGYDDFEYAQKAVKNHVREFLLKPITASELTEALGIVKEELELTRNQEIKQTEMREKLDQSLPLLKERFFNRLVSGRLTRENYERRRDYFKWKDIEQFYQITVIGIPESWDELGRITLQEYIKKSLHHLDETFFNNNENIVIIFQGSDQYHLEARTKLIIENIYNHIGSLEKEQISAGCGEVVNSNRRLHASYSGARNAVDYSRVLGLSQILFIKDVRDCGKILPETFHLMLGEVLEKLKEGKKEETIDAMKAMFLYMGQYFITTDEAFSYYSRIHYTLYVFIQEMGLTSKNNPCLPQQPIRHKSIKLAKTSFLNYITIIESRIEERRNDIILSRIDKSRNIISNRFSDSSFSLQDICNELYLSTSQFSFLFKEGTGQTFIEYLTSYRVEEAKKLLKMSDQKVYEVAESVGYQDPRYFSIIFKKQTGVTALEYRRSLEG